MTDRGGSYANYVIVDQVLYFMRRMRWTMWSRARDDVTDTMSVFLAGMVWAMRSDSLEESRKRVREELERCDVWISCEKHPITKYASDWLTEYVRRALDEHDEIRAGLTEDTDDKALRTVLEERRELP